MHTPQTASNSQIAHGIEYYESIKLEITLEVLKDRIEKCI